MGMREITTRGGCRVKDARSPNRWGVIYVYIAGHWYLTSPRGAAAPRAYCICDRSDLRPRRCCWHWGRAARRAGGIVITLDFDILTAHRVAHCFDAIRRFLVNHDLLLHSGRLPDHRLLVGFRYLNGAVSEVGIVYSRASRSGAAVDRDALGMQGYILLHRGFDDEPTDVGRAVVNQ